MKSSDRPFSIRIPDPLMIELKREAETEGLNLSAVIRRLIIRHCAAKNAPRKARVRVA